MKIKHAFGTPWAAALTWLNRLQCTPESLHPSLSVHSPGRRFFAEGFVAYSYGIHFPLVRWVPDFKAFLLNIDRYSNTTSKHQRDVGSLVRSFAPAFDAQVFRVSNNCKMASLPDVGFAADTLAFYHDTIRETLGKARRARLDCRKSWLGQHAEGWVAERNQFVRTFNLEAPELPEDVTAALVTLKLAA